MADSTLHAMTQNTAPAAADELYLLDDPAGVPANNRIAVSDLIGYGGLALPFASTNDTSLADSTTYYFGSGYGFIMSTTAARRKIWIPRAGTITKIYGHLLITGTLSSGEDSTLSLRLNDTTDTSITTTLETYAVVVDFSKTDLSIAVVAGDYVELKLACPAFGTNPTGVYSAGVIFMK